MTGTESADAQYNTILTRLMRAVGPARSPGLVEPVVSSSSRDSTGIPTALFDCHCCCRLVAAGCHQKCWRRCRCGRSLPPDDDDDDESGDGKEGMEWIMHDFVVVGRSATGRSRRQRTTTDGDGDRPTPRAHTKKPTVGRPRVGGMAASLRLFARSFLLRSGKSSSRVRDDVSRQFVC
jgi:hypothetical protein